jgi:predicted site-specific integrase-resolvase
MSNAAVEKRLSGLLYGWAADLVGQMREKDPKYVRVATAFVLTTIEHEGAMFGYARVSTADQRLDLQVDALTKAGCDRIFTDHASGGRGDRVGMTDALSHLRAGDTLMVWKLDRLGRSGLCRRHARLD